MNFKTIRAVYYDSKEIVRNEILWGLIGMGVNVEAGNVVVDLNYPNEAQIMKIWEEVKNYDVVLTQNFSVNVAAACHIAKVIYISWIYDSPQVALYTDFALFDENYVFCFDTIQVKRLKELGLKHVFYQPLAANIKYIQSLPFTKQKNRPYKSDLSFVGQLYNTPALNTFMEIASSEEIESFKGDVQRYYCNWAPYANIYNQYNEYAHYLSKYINQADFAYYKTAPDFIVKTLIYSIYLAREERMILLGDAAKICDASLNTIERDIELASHIQGLRVAPPVRNQALYETYSSARLNLNISLHSIEDAAPQRIFDITATGGAVISDYRNAIAELFEPDKEILLFQSRDEFTDKIKYYLSHEDQLKNIANAGRKKTTAKYNYTVALQNMFNQI